jgi:excisionase family DNA binding protein
MARVAEQKGATGLLEQPSGETAQGSDTSTMTLSSTATPSNSNGRAPNRLERRAARKRGYTTERARLPASTVEAEIDLSAPVGVLRVDQLIAIVRAYSAVAEPATPPREVLTQEEAADLLRCSVTKVWRLVRDRKIKPRIIGGSRRYLRSELLEYVELAHAAEVSHG